MRFRVPSQLAQYPFVPLRISYNLWIEWLGNTSIRLNCPHNCSGFNPTQIEWVRSQVLKKSMCVEMCLSDTDTSLRINHAITCRQLYLFSSVFFSFSFLFQNSFPLNLILFLLPNKNRTNPQTISGISTKNLAQVVNCYVHLAVQYKSHLFYLFFTLFDINYIPVQ